MQKEAFIADKRLGNYYLLKETNQLVVLATRIGHILLIHFADTIQIPFDKGQYLPDHTTRLIESLDELQPVPLEEIHIADSSIKIKMDQDGSYMLHILNEMEGIENKLYVKPDGGNQYICRDEKNELGSVTVNELHKLQNIIEYLRSPR